MGGASNRLARQSATTSAALRELRHNNTMDAMKNIVKVAMSQIQLAESCYPVPRPT